MIMFWWHITSADVRLLAFSSRFSHACTRHHQIKQLRMYVIIFSTTLTIQRSRSMCVCERNQAKISAKSCRWWCVHLMCLDFDISTWKLLRFVIQLNSFSIFINIWNELNILRIIWFQILQKTENNFKFLLYTLVVLIEYSTFHWVICYFHSQKSWRLKLK